MPEPQKIKVEVRLFAGLRDRAGVRSISVELDQTARIQDAVAAAAEAVPGDISITGHIMFAINRVYVVRDALLNDGDELALIPPVSGGAADDAPRQQVVITAGPLDPEPQIRFVTTDTDGAVVTFLGITRDHNEGRAVDYLEYEAFEPMATEQIGRVIGEMREKWDIGSVAVAHRTGRVDVGETSMVLAVGAAHRRPAFEAALYFIDRLKEVVPIWKKEFFQGGEVWIGETPGSNRS